MLEDFDYRLLEYIYATNTRYESEVSRFNMIEEKQNVTIPPSELEEKYKLYREVNQLHKNGMGIKKIAAYKSISKNTVKKYLRMTNTEFLKTFQKNSVKQYRDHILNYLYKDHKISAKEIYEQLEKDKNIDLNFGKRTFEKYAKYLREKYKTKKK